MDLASAQPGVIVEPKLLGPHSREDLLDAFRAKLNLPDAQFLLSLDDKVIILRRMVIDTSLTRRYQTIAAEGLATTIKTSTTPRISTLAAHPTPQSPTRKRGKAYGNPSC